jgi:hypothetical protein
MTARKLEKAEWERFFDTVSKVLEGKQAEIEVVSLQLGDQIEAEWLPFHGVVYDPKDDILEVELEGVDHLIHHPQEIFVEDGDIGLASMAVVDAEGTREIVKLRDPIALPRPA